MPTELMYDETYAIEIYDAVDVEIDGHAYEGIVTRLFPRIGRVQVRYRDHVDATRSGEPRSKSASVSVHDIALLGRDG